MLIVVVADDQRVVAAYWHSPRCHATSRAGSCIARLDPRPYSGSTSSAVECRSGGICFQSGSDVDALAMDIVAIDHDIAEVYPDAMTATSGSSA